MPLTERAKKVLSLAERIALNTDRAYVGTEEILLALMREANEDPTGPVGSALEAWRSSHPRSAHG